MLWLWTSTALLLTVFLLVYKYVTRHFDHWKKRNVFYLDPTPFFGNIFEIATLKTTIGEWMRKVYNSTDLPYFGIFVFDKPYLVLRSPELIKLVLVKDFNYFKDRTFFSGEYEEVFPYMLFFMKGPGWRGARKKVSPTFTSGRLKAMFPLINNVGEDMKKYLRRNQTEKSIEFKEICAKFSTDVIAKCAFAIDAQSFQNEDAEFRKVGRDLFNFRLRNAVGQLSHIFLPELAKLLHLHFFDKPGLKFLVDVFENVINRRESDKTKRNDMIDILVEMKKEDKTQEFSHEKLLAQPAQFFVAGFETTSSVIAFTLYELCIHPEIQETLRTEILSTIEENNGITYEGLMNMKYLDMCVCETLRKYPVLPFLDRTCDADYKVPGTGFVIEKGTKIYIPMFGLHYDEKYFPNPEEYIPERFSDKSSLNQDGLTYIPFGEGPRICIGERFGLLGTKIGLVSILSEFELEKTPDTPVPLEYEPRSFILQSKVGLPMKFKRIK